MKGPTKANGATPARGARGEARRAGARHLIGRNPLHAISTRALSRRSSPTWCCACPAPGPRRWSTATGRPSTTPAAATRTRCASPPPTSASCSTRPSGSPRSPPSALLVVRAARASFAIHALPDGYALVVLLTAWSRLQGPGPGGVGLHPFDGRRGRVDPSAERLVRHARRRRPREELRDSGSARPERRQNPSPRSPSRSWAATALAEHERAWRVRVPTGVELTLVREPGGFWYADEPVSLPPPRPLRPPRASGKKNL